MTSGGATSCWMVTFRDCPPLGAPKAARKATSPGKKPRRTATGPLECKALSRNVGFTALPGLSTQRHLFAADGQACRAAVTPKGLPAPPHHLETGRRLRLRRCDQMAACARLPDPGQRLQHAPGEKSVARCRA